MIGTITITTAATIVDLPLVVGYVWSLLLTLIIGVLARRQRSIHNKLRAVLYRDPPHILTVAELQHREAQSQHRQPDDDPADRRMLDQPTDPERTQPLLQPRRDRDHQ